MDDLDWYGAITRVVRASRISEDRDALNDVTQLRDIFEDVADPQRADDFNLDGCQSALDSYIGPWSINNSYQLSEIFLLRESIHLPGKSVHLLPSWLSTPTKLSYPPGFGINAIPILVTIP